MARITGALYLLAMLSGMLAVFVGGRWASPLYVIATLANGAVALLFYGIFKPVNRSIAMLAAFFGLMTTALGVFKWHPRGVDVALIFFGFYCLLLGYLIFRSTFLPRILGVLMALAGLAWLTFLLPPLTHYLYPYNLAAGALGQGALILWLLVMGVNAERWKVGRASV
jgi:phosphoglycerol transferase MdoB-like AlkP superfamily enzyme